MAHDRGLPTASLALDASRDEPRRPPIRSLYLHTPFCVHKCHYCDFYSFVDTRDQQDSFIARLIDELRALSPHAAGLPLQTVFVGGGTPSLLRLNLWERLLGAIDELFDLSLIRHATSANQESGQAEFTVECNPESTTPELVRLLRAGGVNRVSIGAQSFHPRHLKTLERWHDPANVARAVELARESGIARQSIDLIFAIPGQTLEEWRADLRSALEIGTTHLSCYNLTYEPNTAMTRRLRLGEFEPVAEETEARMFEVTAAVLHDAGLERYEVSNFSRHGDESLHNLAYWRQEQWLAAGPSASGHAWAGPDMRRGSWRWKNVPRLGDYLASGGDGDALAPVVDLESPDPLRLCRERIMMGLRLREGLDAASLLADLRAVAPEMEDRLISRARREQDAGHLVIDAQAGRWTLTDAGVLLCDHIAGSLMKTLIGPDQA